MAIAVIPPYCANCQHNKVCKILVNIQAHDDVVKQWNTDHANVLQQVVQTSYSCGFKLKTV